jgi:hypothetical protein
VRAALKTYGPWPEGTVAIREEKGSIPNSRARRPQRASKVEMIGPKGPLFDNLTVWLTNDARQELIAEDGLGENRFRIPLSDQGLARIANARVPYNSPSINYAGTYGGLMVVSLGNQLLAADTLRGGDIHANRVLWNEDLNDQIGGLATMQSLTARSVSVKWGPARHLIEDAYGRRYGTVGPVTEDGVYFQRLHDLYGVDPLSGKTIWMRKNVDLGLELFGDEEYLFAAPQEGANAQRPARPGPREENDPFAAAAPQGETLVLRAATGELLGTRRLPPVEERMITVGRNLLAWREADGGYVMEMRDVWLDRVLWSHRFAAGSKADLVGREVVGVFQPDGRFALVRLADGEQLTNARLEREETLSGIRLLASESGYVLVVYTTGRGRATVSMAPFPSASDCELFSGRVYGFDRKSGQKLWPAPVAIAQHGLLLNQPGALPVLVFVRQIHRAGPVGSRDPKLSVLCIDKRTGRVVYEKDDLPGTTAPICDLSCDAAAHTVTISLPTKLITLTYTDDAADPQAAREPSAPGAARLASQ